MIPLPRGRVLWVVLCLAGLVSTTRAQEPGTDRDAGGFLRALPGRPIELPADHGDHPETRTEWWYLTGPLEAADGRRFGFQATWFRRGLVLERSAERSPMAARDVMLFHGALTDVSAGRLHHGEQASRAWPGWAGAAEGRLDVRLLNQTLVDAEGDGRAARMVFDAGEAHLELDLDLAASPVLRHGAEPGLSLKGTEPGQASWYYTLPAIGVRGRLVLPDGETVEVSGRAWMDHEFGSSQLGADQVGWDWFSTVLDDGTVLMAYLLRRSDGSADVTSSGTLLLPDGTSRHLPQDALEIVVRDHWTSPASGARYPAAWTLRVPSADLELDVTPLLDDQELITATTGVTYWEGLCRFNGRRGERPVEGAGYVELVGYGGSVADRFGGR